MIVVDTSALVAILREEPEADRFIGSLAAATKRVMGAPTKFELLLVLGKPLGAAGLAVAHSAIDDYAIEILDWTSALADDAGEALVQYGKGRHRAALNFGDCMSYALAKSLDAPLLFKGNDFALTDVRVAA